MATTRTFQAMLNDYLPNDLLREEVTPRDYLLSKMEKDDGWLGASSTNNEAALIVPFKAAGASSVAFGSLTGSTDIAEDSYVRGRVNAAKEVWGSMLFNQRDLMEHGRISEKNFLKLLPDTIEDFMDYMKQIVSVNLLNGSWFDTVTTANAVNDGNLVVSHPDRFVIGQKVIVKAAADATGYVKTINMNTKTINLVTTRGGATVIDWSGNNVAAAAKIYNDGQEANGFSSLRGALLSSANGGDATLYGVTKTTYPYLQAINVDGSGVTAATIMRDIFDALTSIRQFGKGNPTDIIMSYKNFASCLKSIEASKGAFNVQPGSQKASQYGWTELTVGSVTKGGLKLVAVQEAEDDLIFFIDWRAMKFYSNGFFKKRSSPDGTEYFEVRNTSGYQYIVDVCLFGELVVHRPSYCGVLYSISY